MCRIFTPHVFFSSHGYPIFNSQVLSLPLKSVIPEVANFCAVTDTLEDQDGLTHAMPQPIFMLIMTLLKLYSYTPFYTSRRKLVYLFLFTWSHTHTSAKVNAQVTTLLKNCLCPWFFFHKQEKYECVGVTCFSICLSLSASWSQLFFAFFCASSSRCCSSDNWREPQTGQFHLNIFR